jgi:uncharacterized Zn finger protein
MSTKSKCPKCAASEFEMVVESVKPQEQIHFVRCTKCLTVIGLVDRVIPTRNLSVLEGRLNDLSFKIDQLAKSQKV